MLLLAAGFHKFGIWTRPEMICTYAILLLCFKQEKKKKAGIGDDDEEEEEVMAYLPGVDDEEFDPSSLPDPDKVHISEDEDEER